MRFLRVWAKSPRRKGAPVLFASAIGERHALMSALGRKARLHGIFAISEICRGLAVLGTGDMASADQVGEFVAVAGQTLESLASDLRFARALAAYGVRARSSRVDGAIGRYLLSQVSLALNNRLTNGSTRVHRDGAILRSLRQVVFAKKEIKKCSTSLKHPASRCSPRRPS